LYNKDGRDSQESSRPPGKRARSDEIELAERLLDALIRGHGLAARTLPGDAVASSVTGQNEITRAC
jgi:hypothetical protein